MKKKYTGWNQQQIWGYRRLGQQSRRQASGNYPVREQKETSNKTMTTFVWHLWDSQAVTAAFRGTRRWRQEGMEILFE